LCPQRSQAASRAAEPPAETLSAELVHLLISRVGLDETDVAAMNKEDAITRLQRYWTEGG
jgi:hypothetical protein